MPTILAAAIISSSVALSLPYRILSLYVEVKTKGGEILTVYFEIIGSKQKPTTIRFDEVYLEGEVKVAYEADLWTETLR